jgi:hypothetical protein
MVQFEVDHRRKLLLDPVGGYEWSLKRSIEESRARGGLGGSADSGLGKAIECLLVGFDGPAERLLKQTAEWVRVAIESDERPQRYFPGATEASRYQTLALCNWFLYNLHDLESLERFVVNEDGYLSSAARKDKVGISLTLLTYVNAGAFERTLEIFHTTPGLSTPTSLSPRNEAQMAYIVSRNRLGLQYNQEDVQVATRKFLAKNINAWLSNGHAVRAAEWLKILYWNDGDHKCSAKQVLLKCYEFLPGQDRPA